MLCVIIFVALLDARFEFLENDADVPFCGGLTRCRLVRNTVNPLKAYQITCGKLRILVIATAGWLLVYESSWPDTWYKA